MSRKEYAFSGIAAIFVVAFLALIGWVVNSDTSVTVTACDNYGNPIQTKNLYVKLEAIDGASVHIFPNGATLYHGTVQKGTYQISVGIMNDVGLKQDPFGFTSLWYTGQVRITDRQTVLRPWLMNINQKVIIEVTESGTVIPQDEHTVIIQPYMPKH